MKRIFLFILLLPSVLVASSQENKNELLQDLEKSQQGNSLTATLKSSSRLFEIREDLTSVILVIPAGSLVRVTGSDSAYYKVEFDGTAGYILKKHATINEAPAVLETRKEEQPVQKEETADPKADRLKYLESKYGPSLAARLYAGKIWRGMTSQMVRDSWGTPLKINRDIGNTLVREEWFYKSTCLYIENNTLVNWGPLKN